MNAAARLIRERKPNGDAEYIAGCVYTTNGQIDVNINQLTRDLSGVRRLNIDHDCICSKVMLRLMHLPIEGSRKLSFE